MLVVERAQKMRQTKQEFGTEWDKKIEKKRGWQRKRDGKTKPIQRKKKRLFSPHTHCGKNSIIELNWQAGNGLYFSISGSPSQFFQSLIVWTTEFRLNLCAWADVVSPGWCVTSPAGFILDEPLPQLSVFHHFKPSASWAELFRLLIITSIPVMAFRWNNAAAAPWTCTSMCLKPRATRLQPDTCFNANATLCTRWYERPY